MASGIDEEVDQIISNQGTEWHRFAQHEETITEELVKPLLFDIIESPSYGMVDGTLVQIPNEKQLIADYRVCRPDAKCPLVTLHSPKEGYKVISNREVWDMMSKSIKDLGATITSIGTLERARKFFISVDIGSADIKVKTKKGTDMLKAYLNFITSHDGSVAMTTFDSIIRIVCMNTWRWSLRAAGEVMFKVYHKKNADMAMENLGELMNAILQGRTQLASVMEYLAGHKCDNNDALAMATGYFCTITDSIEQSSRNRNAAEQIATLFARGIGNSGETLYDLANGATEYWTHGDGVGKKAAPASRVYRSSLGSAADHKTAFIAMLTNEGERNNALRMGRDSLALATD